MVPEPLTPPGTLAAIDVDHSAQPTAFCLSIHAGSILLRYRGYL